MAKLTVEVSLAFCYFAGSVLGFSFKPLDYCCLTVGILCLLAAQMGLLRNYFGLSA